MISKKLNLGCGPNFAIDYPDYEGLDAVDYGQKYYGDIKTFIVSEKEDEPSKDVRVMPCKVLIRESYDEIMAYHFMEHFSQEELQHIFNLVWEILKPEGRFKIIVPHRKKGKAWVLSHKTFWDEETFKWLEREDLEIVYGFKRWKIVELVVNSRKDIFCELEKI
jgi:cyclopropane fatty-acyl-phospholipid synthase-like methyltransferase